MHITYFFTYFFLNPYSEGSYPFIENVSTKENGGRGEGGGMGVISPPFQGYYVAEVKPSIC